MSMPAATDDRALSRRPPRVARLLPGIFLAATVALAALGLEALEERLIGQHLFGSLVLAIVLGTLLRSTGRISERFAPGIRFSAHTVLEVAIVLLGASISAAAIGAAGAGLVGGIAVIVLASIAISFGIGRLVGLNRRLAMLVACGNSICGNSAIVAVAPVIDADPRDTASAIAFTAVLGILVVLILPFLAGALELDSTGYGIIAGMTVYAVPQVLAAAQGAGALAAHVGMLVKLIRVMMLGPVILLLGLFTAKTRGRGRSGPNLHQMIPWFVAGFALMMAARSLGLIPEILLPTVGKASNALTAIAMAGLGLTVDLRDVAHASGRVILAASLSIATLAAISIGFIHLLQSGGV